MYWQVFYKIILSSSINITIRKFPAAPALFNALFLQQVATICIIRWGEILLSNDSSTALSEFTQVFALGLKKWIIMISILKSMKERANGGLFDQNLSWNPVFAMRTQ